MSDTFPVFDYPFEESSTVKYPKPIRNVKDCFPLTTPTCSWMQNALSDNTLPGNRFMNQLPWYVTVYYDRTETDEGASYGFASGVTAQRTFDVTDGNLGIVDDYSPTILFYSVGTGYPMLSKYDNISCLFGGNDSMLGLRLIRGSPLVTFYPAAEGMVVKFPTNITSSTDNTVTIGPFRTTTTTHFIQRDSVLGVEGSLAGGTLECNPSSNRYKITIDAQTLRLRFTVSSSELTGTNLDISISLLNGAVVDTKVSQKVSSVTSTRPESSTLYTVTVGLVGSADELGFDISVLGKTLDVYTYYYKDNTPTYYFSRKGTVLANSITFDGSGSVDYGEVYDSSILQLYTTHSSNTEATVTISSPLVFNYGSPTLLFLPKSWEGVIVEPLPKYFKYSYESATYNTVKVAEVPATFTMGGDPMPEFGPMSVKINSDILLRTSNVDYDVFLQVGPPIDQYSFGVSRYAMCRMMQIMDKLTDVADFRGPVLFKKVYMEMKSWLEGTNLITPPGSTCSRPENGPPSTDSYLMFREKYWGSIITPSDYYFYYYPCYYGVAGFFNSYCGDHHFQWGYFYFIILSISQLCSSTKFNPGNLLVPLTELYPTRIQELLRDVCNPTTTAAATTTRHKDWYALHSWATGFNPNLPPTDPQASVSGPLERNEEAAGEAINCYYSAYHLAIALGLSDVADCAASCYLTEVAATIAFNFNTDDTSAFTQRTPTLSLIGNRYRKCLTLGGTQPVDHWGTMVDTNTLMFSPYGETSDQLLLSGTRQWPERVRGSNVDPYTGHESYSVTLKGLQSLLEGAAPSYTPALAVNENAATIPPDPYQLWIGGVIQMLKCLSVPSDVDKSLVQGIFSNALTYTLNNSATTVPSNDSYTNTAYWLLRYDTLSSNTTDNVGFGVEDSVTGCKLPKVTCRSLLSTSKFASQGLVNVPQVFSLACLIDKSVVKVVLFRVIDDRSYKNECPTSPDKQCGRCIEYGVVPGDIVVTEFKLEGDCLFMIDAKGSTYWEKAQSIQNGVTGNSLLTYTMFRFFLWRLLRGQFDCKYLGRSYWVKFEKYMARSRFCYLLQSPEYIAIRHYWKYYKDA